MEIDDQTLKMLDAAKVQKESFRKIAMVWSIVMAALIMANYWVYSYLKLPPQTEVGLTWAGAIVFGFCLFKSLSYGLKFRNNSELLKDFEGGWERLSLALNAGTASALASTLATLKQKENSLLQGLIQHSEKYLNDLIDARYRSELQQQFEQEVKQFEEEYLEKATELRNQHPLYKAYYALDFAEAYLKQRRVEIEKQWDEAMSKTSWWNQLVNGGALDFKDLDMKIESLKLGKLRLTRTHEKDFDAQNEHYGKLAKQAFTRMAQTKIATEQFIQQCHYDDAVGNDMLKQGFLLASLSVPVSLWSDVNQAGDIYEVLRSVNGDYAGLSDAEIWWETLFLQSESLAGLISLTKGAYLEHIVATDTGGQLFEHFNHPDTDIVIDGVAFQIKATDSADYIHSVEDGIPVIATTEVANLTDAIDSGYRNEDLHEAVSLAVGGAVIDVGDTAVDAILTGIGGLGVLASLQGINHAVKQHENGGDPVEAMFEGVGIAIEGTARAAVNTLELGHNVITSRPSRFVGRQLLKALVALDNKMMSAGEPKNK